MIGLDARALRALGVAALEIERCTEADNIPVEFDALPQEVQAHYIQMGELMGCVLTSNAGQDLLKQIVRKKRNEVHDA